LSWAHFEGTIQKAIHRLKYHRDLGLVNFLVCGLLEIFEKSGWNVDLVTAVPQEKSRYRLRGYNHAALLARYFSTYSGTTYKNKAIRKIKPTRPQVGLSLTERQINLEGVFHADKTLVQEQSILIIDDVVTTGETLNQCAKALLDGQADQVFGLTVARVGEQNWE
jgi:ComF family protein